MHIHPRHHRLAGGEGAGLPVGASLPVVVALPAGVALPVGVAPSVGVGPNAVRNRSRKESIRQTGVCGPGFRPSCQPQPAVRSMTARSRGTIVIGTLRLAAAPGTIEAGWWSPRNTNTRLSSP